VFVVGYCFGGAMTWQAAGRIEGIAASSSYYGGHTASMADLTPKCPIICHFGRKDAHIRADEIKATLQAAQPQIAVYIYEKSGHGFNNDGRPGSDPDDAALARKRTSSCSRPTAQPDRNGSAHPRSGATVTYAEATQISGSRRWFSIIFHRPEKATYDVRQSPLGY
jgi:hypothetical protein